MITKNYIKMCEQAEEIQSEWMPKDWDRFAYKDSREMGIACVDKKGPTKRELKENLMYRFWLPTQEQLQEMIGKQLVKLDGEISKMANMFFISNDNQILWNEFWLMFVMYEKYHKIWTGENWEKE